MGDVAELMSYGATILPARGCDGRRAEMIPDIQVEATFPDGTKAGDGSLPSSEASMIPGEILTLDGDIELNSKRKTQTIAVANSGDRPIQVGSHYHFFETNNALQFDRTAARGMRLNIAAGTAVRFEPGQSRTIDWSNSPEPHGYGFQGLVMGPLARAKPAGKTGDDSKGHPPAKKPAAKNRRQSDEHTLPPRLRRDVRPDHWGPCSVCRYRTFIEVERDLTTYGEGQVRWRQGHP